MNVPLPTKICAICRADRPENELGTFPGETDGMHLNVYYCLDNPRCVAMAKTRNLVLAAQASALPYTGNRFLVGKRGEEIAIILPIPNVMDRETALNLAVWLVAMTDHELKEFTPMLKEILKS